MSRISMFVEVEDDRITIDGANYNEQKVKIKDDDYILYYPEQFYDEFDPEDVGDYPNNIALLVTHNDHSVGELRYQFIAYNENDKWTIKCAYCHYVFVKKEYRKKGIGSFLMQTMIDSIGHLTDIEGEMDYSEFTEDELLDFHGKNGFVINKDKVFTDGAIIRYKKKI